MIRKTLGLIVAILGLFPSDGFGNVEPVEAILLKLHSNEGMDEYSSEGRAIIQLTPAQEQELLGKVIPALQSGGKAIQLKALFILREMGNAAAPAIPEILKCLESENVDLRQPAARAIGEIGFVSREVLIKLLEGNVNNGINYYLGAIHQLSSEAVPYLLDIAKDKNMPLAVRYKAIDSLYGKTLTEKESEEAVKTASDFLVAPDGTVQTGMLGCLGSWGRLSEKAIPFILEVIRRKPGEKGHDVRWLAIQCLAQIGSGKYGVISELIKALNDSPPVCWQAVEALKIIGPEGRAAVEPLLRIARAQSGEIIPTSDLKRLIISCLGQMGYASEDQLLFLIDASSEKDSMRRVSALEALGNMGEKGKAAIPLLVKALEEEDEFIRKTSADSLGRLSLVARHAAPKLKEMSQKDPSELARWEAYKALKLMAINDANYLPVVGKPRYRQPPFRSVSHGIQYNTAIAMTGLVVKEGVPIIATLENTTLRVGVMKAGDWIKVSRIQAGLKDPTTGSNIWYKISHKGIGYGWINAKHLLVPFMGSNRINLPNSPYFFFMNSLENAENGKFDIYLVQEKMEHYLLLGENMGEFYLGEFPDGTIKIRCCERLRAGWESWENGKSFDIGLTFHESKPVINKSIITKEGDAFPKKDGMKEIEP